MNNPASTFIKIKTNETYISCTSAYECMNVYNQKMIIRKDEIVFSEDGSKFIHKNHFETLSLDAPVLVSKNITDIDKKILNILIIKELNKRSFLP
ncbi:MAG: hypothetical protein AUK54_09580 [Helicobacteraceae bacterium CG2_30_36_10]|nr:MAG: hypothetical protein AUK54_09580 [Helicobacteraceae bacterium CG2_30_36_10]